ncbi:uncharacterized protein LOC110344805 isoform X3 [Heterocephalus glaber]|uniref:Uncharacterized protein LOC110344805 isoform X3 n=1 Tax=Heterocephalus glaber TaxID=10181 RepID=A0AAX6RIF8_HETGA|nr:uncharacterized protein LOC110344805 isoform X3 [Heterocephalus glaber]
MDRVPCSMAERKHNVREAGKGEGTSEPREAGASRSLDHVSLLWPWPVSPWPLTLLAVPPLLLGASVALIKSFSSSLQAVPLPSFPRSGPSLLSGGHQGTPAYSATSGASQFGCHGDNGATLLPSVLPAASVWAPGPQRSGTSHQVLWLLSLPSLSIWLPLSPRAETTMGCSQAWGREVMQRIPRAPAPGLGAERSSEPLSIFSGSLGSDGTSLPGSKPCWEKNAAPKSVDSLQVGIFLENLFSTPKFIDIYFLPLLCPCTFFVVCLFLFLFLRESHYVAQAGLELKVILLPLPPEYWDDRAVPPCLAVLVCFNIKIMLAITYPWKKPAALGRQG